MAAVPGSAAGSRGAGGAATLDATGPGRHPPALAPPLVSPSDDDLAARRYTLEEASAFVTAETRLPDALIRAVLDARERLHAVLGLCESPLSQPELAELRRRHADLLSDEAIAERFLSWEAEVGVVRRETALPLGTICEILAADARYLTSLGFSDDDGSGYLALAADAAAAAAPRS